MNRHSVIHFPGTSRIHVALAVKDLQLSRKFYETLLGAAPTKVRPGYAKFEPQNPSVNLTLNEIADASALSKPATHYGIQVKSTQAVQDAIARLTNAGLATTVEEDVTCCFAVQDKVWISDPDGNRWEVFVVLEADADQSLEQATCCSTPTTNACC